ncbi:hypothetical protein BI330_01270 [Mycobacterium sp. CBMA 623]|nr:hypothetical protein [Mycobacteroides sp. CBMA 326]
MDITGAGAGAGGSGGAAHPTAGKQTIAATTDPVTNRDLFPVDHGISFSMSLCRVIALANSIVPWGTVKCLCLQSNSRFSVAEMSLKNVLLEVSRRLAAQRDAGMV